MVLGDLLPPDQAVNREQRRAREKRRLDAREARREARRSWMAHRTLERLGFVPVLWQHADGAWIEHVGGPDEPAPFVVQGQGYDDVHVTPRGLEVAAAQAIELARRKGGGKE